MQAITTSLVKIILYYLVGTYIRSSRSVASKKDDDSCFLLFFLVISPEQISEPNSLLNGLKYVSYIWWIDKDQKRCRVPESQVLLSLLSTYVFPLNPKYCASQNSHTV